MVSKTGGFFIATRRGGGLFSIVATVLANLAEAERLGLTPFVDLESLPTPYQEVEPVHGTRNVWEYYFEQVSKSSRHDALAGATVISGSGFPKGYSDSLLSPVYRDMWKKYLVLNEKSKANIRKTFQEVEPDFRTLGVHFRGQEQRTASRHPLPPTLRQMRKAIENALNVGDFERILLVTEAQQYVDYFAKSFGKRVISSPTFRMRFTNVYTLKKSPRALHRYRLGLETLADAVALGSCGGLISCNSNLSEASALIGGSNHTTSLVLNNGFNVASPVTKKLNWYFKASLPSALGGFPSWDMATRDLVHEGITANAPMLPELLDSPQRPET